MKNHLFLTPVLLVLLVSQIFAKGEVTKVYAHYEDAKASQYDADRHTLKWGRSKNLVIDGFEYQGTHYQYQTMANKVQIVRHDNKNATGNPCGLFAEKKRLNTKYKYKPSFPEGCDMAKVMGGRVINVGALDLFRNSGSTAKNIERVDFIFQNAIKAPANTTDLEKAGHVVTEKSGNNPIKIAAILSLDANGKPASYGPLVGVHTRSSIDYGITKIYVKNRNNPISKQYLAFLVNEKKGTQGKPWYLSSSHEPLGMAFVSLKDLGVSAGSTYYGFSYFGEDVTSSHDLTKPETFPVDHLNDTADPYGGVAGYFMDEVIVPTPPESTNNEGTCYAMSDDAKYFYQVQMKPGASTLPEPVEKSMSRRFNGEGSAYRASDKKIYAFQATSDDRGPSTLYKIDVETSVIDKVKDNLLGDAVDGAEFFYDKTLNKEILYVTSGEEQTKLYAFDTTDWSVLGGYPKNLSGDVRGVSSIAINPVSGDAYGIDDYNYDHQKPTLYKIDLTTGHTTKIKQLNEIVDAEGLAYASDGNLYIEDEGYLDGRKIYKVDLTDGSLIPAAILGGNGDIEGLSCNGTELAHKSEISGHVYQDSDALADISAKIGIENAKVSLYDESGTVVGTTNTDADGAYHLFAEEGSYTVSVDSKSLSNKENVWMEQTYAPKGGICSEVVLESAGACYGGKRGDVSDDNSALESAEHVVQITVGEETIDDLDFGFSTNVVVNAEDNGQGSLRQFIKNANAVSGANRMKFVPAVAPNSTTWWTITLDSALPVISDDATTIDGTAYDTNGTVRDENSGTAGHGGTKVGTGADGVEGTGDEAILPNFNRPELEINANDQMSDASALVIVGDNITIKHIALYNTTGGSGIYIKDGQSTVIKENFVGSRADGSKPSDDARLEFGIYHDSAKVAAITGNYIAYVANTGLFADSNAYVAFNDFYKAANLPHGDAMTTERSSGDNIMIENNRIEGASAYGIESWNSPSIVTMRNNTLIANGQDTSDSNSGENGGIRVYGENNTIEFNIVRDHPGVGIVITGEKSGNKISKNAIYHNGGLGIDIDLRTSGNRNGDGVSLNNGTLDESASNKEMDYPVFTSARLAEGTLYVKGYIGTAEDQAAFDGSRVEVFLADANVSDISDVPSLRDDDGVAYIVHGEGRRYLGNCTTSGNGNFDCSFDTNISIGDHIVATATGSENSTSEFGANMVVSEKPSGVFEPFICSNALYLSNSNILGVGANTSDMYLHSINISQNPFTFPSIGEAYGKTYNALAYNLQDNYLYALYGDLLVRIDKHGNVQEVGKVEGITSQHYSGTFGKDGYYYIGNWAKKSEILKIDIEKLQIVGKIALGKNIEHWDMTVSNDGKMLYLVNVDSGKFTKVDIATGDVSELGASYTGGYKDVSSIFSDIDNRVFIILNGGGFYEIDPMTGERYFISDTPELSGLNDGANCPNASLSFYDLGDAPESFGVAEQRIIQSLKLGNLVDHEQNASKYFSMEASADDESGINDEDSIDTALLSTLSQTTQHFSLAVNVVNKTGMTTILRGWIDFDRNGHFDDDEAASIDVPDEATKVTLSWNVTSDIAAGKSYLRLTLSDKGDSHLGEVEDYTLNIKPRPLLDAWDHELSINNKKIKTKKVNSDIVLSVASLNPMGDAYMSSAYSSIKAALFAKVGENSEALTAWKVVDLSDRNITDIDFGKVTGAYKNAYVSISYKDEFNITRETNASDLFSIRPDKYKLDIPTGLVAGNDFNVTIQAVDVEGVTVENYEEDADVYQLDINETKAGEGCSLGNITVKDKRAFIAGKSIVTLNYDDIGRLQFNVYEINTTTSEFAQIDEDDGSTEDERIITKTEGTSDEIMAAKIRLESVFSSDGINGYTYYAGRNSDTGHSEIDDMAAKLYTKVQVENAFEDVVKNFKPGCYAKDIDMKVTYHALGEPNLIPEIIYTETQTGDMPSMPAPTEGENSFAFHISQELFEEGEGNQSVKINFNREKNVALNPFKLTITDVNASLSAYSVSDNAVPTGTESVPNETTFIYIRAHVPSPQFNIGHDKNVTIQYEVYAKDINQTAFGLQDLPESEDAINWYVMPVGLTSGLDYHDNPKPLFGGTTSTSSGPSGTIPITLTYIDHRTMGITVAKLPHQNKIIYKPTTEYLKFDKYNASVDSHSFKIDFRSDKPKWTGKGDLGKTVDQRAYRGNGLQKIDW